MLDDAKLTAALAERPDWRVSADRRRITRTFRAADFAAAVGLIDRIAAVAEEMNHHPDLHLTGYRDLTVVTTSHDVGRLTGRDLRLAAAVDGILG